jgi:folate-binding protein YgfZ
MPNASAFTAAVRYRPAENLVSSETLLPARFGDVGQEYRAARERVALFDRSDRGLIVLTGTDRKTWLQNLVTNEVAALDEGTGNYVFATDLKARVLFDLNVHCVPGALWLDIDRAFIPRAVAHFERFLITEDAQVRDASGDFARLAWAGPAAGELAARLRFAEPGDMPPLASAASAAAAPRLVRHDFTGTCGFELIVLREEAPRSWDRLVEAGAAPAGFLALDVMRIEAGIPWFGRDIDEKVVALEADPAGRAISFKKGCYVGHEVVERMRSRGAQARRLVRLRAPLDAALDVPCDLRKDGQVVGRITSLVRHPLEPVQVGLGYVKASLNDARGINSGQTVVQFAPESDAVAVEFR